MNRRQLLAGSGAIAVSALSGCLGYELADSSELEANEKKISELEADLEERKSRIQELQSEIDTVESDLSTKDEELSELHREKDTLVEQHLIDLYTSAYDFYETSEEEMEEGFSATQSDDWTDASAYFGSAFGQYNGMLELTYRLESLALEEGYDDAADIALDANSYAEHMANAADHYAFASMNYARGNSSAGSDEVDQGDEQYSSAQSYSVQRISTFQNAI